MLFEFNLGAMFWVSSVLLKTLMGWDVWFSIILCAGVVGLYTVFGGLAAVIMTDVVQLVIMFVGGFAVLFLGLHMVGGWEGMVTKINMMGEAYSSHFELIQPVDTETPFPWTGILFGLTFVMSNAYMIGNQAIVQRCLSAKNEWHAKASMILGSFLKMMIPLLVLFPGMIAIISFPDLKDGDEAFPMLIRTLLPPGLGGLVFAAFFAGLMSSIDSVLNSTATLFTRDIYGKYIKKTAEDRHYLFVGRIVTVTLLILGVATSKISSFFPGIYVAIQTFLSFLQGPTFSVLLLGIFWKRSTQWGGLAGMLSGIAVSALLYTFKGNLFTIEDPFLYVSWWSFVAGLVVNIVVSFASRPHPDEHLYGLVYRLAERKTAKS
jgi:SSS family solute:Na+ symporter